MGVPSFFKWLCMRCPRILHDVVEGIPREVLEEDEDYLNHTDLEIDNLYLDMNCIIHPCSHPDHLVQTNYFNLVSFNSISLSQSP